MCTWCHPWIQCRVCVVLIEAEVLPLETPPVPRNHPASSCVRLPSACSYGGSESVAQAELLRVQCPQSDSSRHYHCWNCVLAAPALSVQAELQARSAGREICAEFSVADELLTEPGLITNCDLRHGLWFLVVCQPGQPGAVKTGSPLLVHATTACV